MKLKHFPHTDEFLKQASLCLAKILKLEKIRICLYVMFITITHSLILVRRL